MSTLSTTRVARDRAKAALTDRLALVRGDLAVRSIGVRIADKIVGETSHVALETAEVVESHKLIVGSTLGAIVLWLLRNPIIAAIRRVSARFKKRGRGVWS